MGRRPSSLRSWWCAGLLAVAVGVFAQDPLARNYTLQDGLPSNTVYWVMQDREGYMWFGTDAGACRFDGRTFRTFTADDGLVDNEVLEVHQDSRGRIWFLSFNGRLCYYADGWVHNEWNTPFLRECHVVGAMYGMVEDAQGALWFGSKPTDLLVLHPDGQVERPRPEPPGIYSASPHPFYIAREGDSILVLNEGDLYRPHLEGKPWRKIGPVPFERTVNSVGDDHLRGWVVTDSGLAVMGTDDRIRPMVNWRFDDMTLHHPGIRVQATPNGSLWVSCLPRGVVHFMRKGDGHAPGKLLFPKERISCALEDRIGDVWLTSLQNGVILVPREQANSIRYQGAVAPAQEEFHSLLLDHDGSLWAGSDRGVIYHVHDDRMDTLDVRAPNALANRVTSLAQDLQGDIWFTSDGYVGHARATAQGIQLASVPFPYSYKSVAVAPDGSVMASMFGVQRMVDDPVRGWLTYMLDPKLPFKRVYHLLYDHTGALWFEDADKLLRLDQGGLEQYTIWGDGHTGRINTLGLFGGDTIVVGTEAGGIGLYHAGRLVAVYDRAHGLASDQCRAVCVRGGCIHVVTAAGLDIIDPRTRKVTNTDLLDGLAANRVNQMVMDDHFLYLASAQGLLKIPREHTVQGGLAAPLLFSSIQVNGTDRQAGALFLRHGHDRLVVEATLLSYALGGDPEYQYRTAPDAPWTNSPSGRLELAALEPGDHELRIRGRMPGHAWSMPLNLSIHVEPPFWRSWWFRSLLALAATILVFQALRWWNIRRWRGRTAMLRQQELLTRERQRIAMDVHDDLGADLSNLLLLSRVAVQEQQGGSSTLLRMEGLATGMMERIDEIIWSLDPRQDTLGATVAFLDRYASDLARSHDLLFRSHVLDTEDRTPLPAPYRRDLYLILKEALNNVAKHARARHLRFQTVVQDGRLRLLVEDDGVGPAPGGPTARTGNGLANMQRRARSMGGTVRVSSVPTGGTLVEIEVPLEPARPNG